MSELIHNEKERNRSLCAFVQRMTAGENGRLLFEEYRQLIETVTPTEAMMALDHLLASGMPVPTVKAWTGKIINLFYKSLAAYEWDKPAEGHFLYYLSEENRVASEIMSSVKTILKKLPEDSEPAYHTALSNLKELIVRLKEYELHYIKKENILFPIIEKTFPQYRCLQLMWSFHDDFRRLVKSIEAILSSGIPQKTLLINEMGKLFFVVLPIIFREEQIVFPVALKSITADSWNEMLAQSKETGWCFNVQPAYGKAKEATLAELSGTVNLGTGFLTPEQIMLLLNNVPVDITFVDEYDEVRFFSGGKQRIFHRSKAIIGRKVQNCHPPESVGTVNEIIRAFREGRQDHADFWIESKDRFIHIRYFALRDETENYKGTIEVSQDVTDIRALEGQRRLLNWEG